LAHDPDAADRGEALADWNDAISEVACCLALIEASRSRSGLSLGQWVTWSRNAAGRFVSALDVRLPDGKRMRFGPMDVPSVYRAFDVPERDARAFARFVVQTTVGGGLGAHARVGMHWNNHHARLEITPEPVTLLGAIWIQVARLAEGGVSHQVCENPGCDEVLLIGATDDAGRRTRTTRATYSERCKKARQRAMGGKKKAQPALSRERAKRRSKQRSKPRSKPRS
jgi:hypothetical protein